MYWLDYSAAKLSGTTIKNAGYGGVIRYIDAPDRLRTKHTNLAEYRDHLANGLTVRLVMEVAVGDANGGWVQGVAYAQRALAGANMLGYGGVIYFCNDTPTLSSSTLWDDYLTGAASVLGWGRVGAYGFANAMDVAAHMTDCRHFWQAGRKSDVRPLVQIWQDNNTQVTVGGITCDRNLIMKDLGGDDVELTDKVTWFDGHEVPVKDILAEVYIAARGLSGKRAFDSDPTAAPVVQLPPLVAIKTGVDGLGDDEAKVIAEMRATKGDLMIAMASIDNTWSAEEAAELAAMLNVHLSGAYTVSITPVPTSPDAEA